MLALISYMAEDRAIRKFLRISAMLVVLSFGPLAAEPLPGADDPQLREAALAWLAEDEPDAALWAMGELAADGNVAARVLVNKIYRAERTSLSRDAVLRLVPQDRTGASRGLGPYPVDHDAYPALRALRQIGNSETADEWIAHAQVIIAAGMQSRLAPFVEVAVLFDYSLNIEVAEFSAVHLRDDPYTWDTLIYFFAFSHLTAEQLAANQSLLDARRWQVRWTEDPWPHAREDAFAWKLLAHSWEALRIEGWTRHYHEAAAVTARLVDPALLDDELLRLADLVSSGPSGPEQAPDAPSEVELQRLGQIYRRYATRAPYAVPTITLCERHCPSRVAACIGSVGLIGDIGFTAYPNYTPVLTVEEYYHSERAVRAHHHSLGNVDFPQPGDPEWMVLPQCMVDSLPARVD